MKKDHMMMLAIWLYDDNAYEAMKFYTFVLLYCVIALLLM